MFKKLVAIEPVNLVPEAFEELKKYAKEIVLCEGVPQDDAEKIRRIGDADAVLISWTSTLGRSVIEACPNIRYIGMCCSLYSEESANVDIKAARERGITVTGVRDYGDNGVAEYVVSELVAYLHGFGPLSWLEKQKELTDMKVGVIGLGTTGTLIAQRLQPFGAKLFYFSRTRKPEQEAEGIQYLPLEQLLETVDVACLCLNKNVLLMGEEQFRHFGSHKILFNTSIGPGHETAALEKWLEQEDNVFFCDNAGGVGSPALLEHPRVVCRNKASGSTIESTYRLSRKVLDNIQRYLES